MKIKTKDLALYGILIALYVVITTFNPIAYGPVQFRISEIILILPFWNKKFILPCVIAVALANVFSPLGPIDVLTGVVIALITYYGAMKVTSNKWMLALLYSIICGVLVGLELLLVFQVPYVLSVSSITVSQIIITFVGVVILNQLDKVGVLKGEYHE